MRIDRAVSFGSERRPAPRGVVLIALVFFFAPTPRAGLADERDSRAAVDFFERSVRPVLSAIAARSAIGRGSNHPSCDWTAARRSSRRILRPGDRAGKPDERAGLPDPSRGAAARARDAARASTPRHGPGELRARGPPRSAGPASVGRSSTSGHGERGSQSPPDNHET